MAPISSASNTPANGGGSDLKIALVLGGACGLGAALVVPYLATLFPELREQEVPLWAIALISAVQNGVLSTGLAWVGIRAGRGLGLGAPHLERWLSKEAEAKEEGVGWSGLVLSIALAAAVSLVVTVADLWFFLPRVTPIRDIPTAGPLVGLLASFYGGIAEEVIVRLFAMTAMTWLLVKAGVRNGVSAVIAIVAAAAVFGLLHLPTAFQLFEPSALSVARVLFLNMALGIPFGWIYWRRGLEQAMLAHFCADLVLHVVTPVLLG